MQPNCLPAGHTNCCWRGAPITGVNTGETKLSEIEPVQVLILDLVQCERNEQETSQQQNMI